MTDSKGKFWVPSSGRDTIRFTDDNGKTYTPAQPEGVPAFAAMVVQQTLLEEEAAVCLRRIKSLGDSDEDEIIASVLNSAVTSRRKQVRQITKELERPDAKQEDGMHITWLEHKSIFTKKMLYGMSAMRDGFDALGRAFQKVDTK